MEPVGIRPKFGRRSTPALFAYSCIKKTGFFFAEVIRGRDTDGCSGTDGEVPVSMILRRAKEEFGAVVPLVDASDL